LYQGGTRVTVRHEDFGHSQPAFEHAAGWEHLLEWLAAYLYSLQGFQYCDLLLAEAERAAQTLKWEEGMRAPLLDLALHHLTLGRTALYAAILRSRSRQGESALRLRASQHGLASAATEIDHAVSGLRRAGQQDNLPNGLLTRAWLRNLTGPATGTDSAQSDLDEAWEIAERGVMPRSWPTSTCTAPAFSSAPSPTPDNPPSTTWPRPVA
jgi:hypothetical protein